MKKIVKPLIIVLSSSLWACSPPSKPLEEYKEPKEVIEDVRLPRTDISSSLPTYKFEFSSLELNMPLSQLDQRVFKHFGEFYTEDFSIYQLDRIDYLAEGYYIDEINLYFIDSALVKIQAFFREDKTNELINRYGKAKIFVSDYYNRKLLETEKVLTKTKTGYQLNDKLNQYKLKWNREKADIQYEVNEKIKNDSIIQTVPKPTSILNPANFKYKLTFQAKDFDYQMAWIKWESYKESRGIVTQVQDQ